MKILLVGGMGFLGKRFIKKFSKIHELVIYAKKDNIAKERNFIELENVILEEGGVEEEKIEQVILKHRPDVVIHLAALTGLKRCHDDPEKAFKINVYGTFNVVNSCIKTKSKLIFISSREVYGETLNNETSEDDKLIPNNIYGITKLLGEILVKQASLSQGLDYTILRLTNVYGPEGDKYGAQVIIKKALKENKIQILGGKQRLNFIFVDDVVDLMGLIIGNEKASKEIFNVGTKDTLTIEEFSNIVKKLIGKKIDLEYHPMRETETSNFEPSLKKIQNILGFKPNTDIESGLKKTIEWYSN